jgi:Ca-activated chloride channel family protein
MNDDSRLTAYALGELAGPERDAFERELATNPDLQHAMKETIALADTLVASAPEHTLADEARAALRERCAANLRAETRARKIRRRVTATITALAACLAVGLLLVLSVPAVNNARVQGHLAAAKNEASLAETDKSLPTGPVFALRSDKDTKFDGAIHYGSAIHARAATTSPSEAKPATSVDLVTAPTVTTTSGQQAQIALHSEIAGSSSGSFGLAGGAVGRVTKAKLVAGMAADATTSTATLSPTIPSGTKQPFFGLRADAPASAPPQCAGQPFHTEAYDAVEANRFLDAQGNPLSTFSIDVDTASYANVRRFLNAGQLPPAGAVRLEELVNYFPYALPQPDADAPFSVTAEVSRAPWNGKHLLARIALKGREIATDKLPPSNLVFLIDVSGSMDEPDKLPLLQTALRGLVQRLRPNDHVAMVVYAGNSGLVLPSTAGEDKSRILEAIDRLEAGGSTNGAAGIELAYQTAREHFLKDGNNRVILCTDGDFNVGVTSQSELVQLIERERESGIFLSVLGFGTGNVKDSTMEKLADKGDGNYAYIDSAAEARKVLGQQMSGTLFTIAKDVKIQIEFNPATVAGYRLLGYENRLLAKEDFNDDKKDAGEIGAGHTVTALYEIIPAGQALPESRPVDPLKYQPVVIDSVSARGGIQPLSSQPSTLNELLTVKLRYKAPTGGASKLLEKAVTGDAESLDKATADFRFASAVAAFAMKLRGGHDDATMDWSAIQQLARGTLGDDPGASRAEFLTLVEKAKALSVEEQGEKR